MYVYMYIRAHQLNYKEMGLLINSTYLIRGDKLTQDETALRVVFYAILEKLE